MLLLLLLVDRPIAPLQPHLLSVEFAKREGEMCVRIGGDFR